LINIDDLHQSLLNVTVELFLFGHRPNFFEITEKLSHFGQNVSKYRLSTVTACFNATVRQMTEMSK